MPKRVLQGVVVSDKQAKTVVVKVERRFKHPLFQKTVRKTKNYHAHDEVDRCKVGDQVSIMEAKPISKLKRWVVLERGEGRGGVTEAINEAAGTNFGTATIAGAAAVGVAVIGAAIAGVVSLSRGSSDDDDKASKD